MDTETVYAIALSYAPGIGPLRQKKLKLLLGSNKEIFYAHKDVLEAAGIGEKTYNKFNIFRSSFDLKTEILKLQSMDIWVVTPQMEEFPPLLREIPTCPFILFGRGDKKFLREPQSVAVVGTRKPSNYGKIVTEKLTRELIHSGWLIVSGMALGIDGIAHGVSLAEAGKTIAVLGCGIDICYPPSHRNLYEHLIKKGAVISEYPPGTITQKGIFPSRNRIVAGMVKAVLVTEGTENSGSLITAQYALDFNRDVYAVPGQITQGESAATFILIRNGAKPVASARDINEEYDFFPKQKPNQALQSSQIDNLYGIEKEIILEITNSSSSDINNLSRKLNIPVSQLLISITKLQMQGLIKEQSDNTYSLVL